MFTSEDLTHIRDVLLSNKKEAPAKAGAIAPLDVFVPPGNTGQGPEKTSFFQALAIPTKITKGSIEILSDIHLIKKDEKVCLNHLFIIFISSKCGMLILHPNKSENLILQFQIPIMLAKFFISMANCAYL